MFLLDTNAWIALFRGKSPRLLGVLQARRPEEIVLCSVVLSELWYGVLRSDPAYRQHNSALDEQLRTTYISLPFDDAAARECAELRAELAGLGRPIGPNDALIASIARVHGITLVTNNTAEFARVPRLLVADWQGQSP